MAAGRLSKKLTWSSDSDDDETATPYSADLFHSNRSWHRGDDDDDDSSGDSVQYVRTMKPPAKGTTTTSIRKKESAPDSARNVMSQRDTKFWSSFDKAKAFFKEHDGFGALKSGTPEYGWLHRTSNQLDTYHKYMSKGRTPQQYDEQAGSQGLSSDKVKEISWIINAFNKRPRKSKSKHSSPQPWCNNGARTPAWFKPHVNSASMDRHPRMSFQQQQALTKKFGSNPINNTVNPYANAGKGHPFQSPHHNRRSMEQQQRMPFQQSAPSSTVLSNMNRDTFDASSYFLDPNTCTGHFSNQTLYRNLVRMSDYRLSFGSVHKIKEHTEVGKNLYSAALAIADVSAATPLSLVYVFFLNFLFYIL